MKSWIIVLCLAVCVSGHYKYGKPMGLGMSRRSSSGAAGPLFPVPYAEAWPKANFAVGDKEPPGSSLYSLTRGLAEDRVTGGRLYHLSFWVWRNSWGGGYYTFCHAGIHTKWLLPWEVTYYICSP